MTAQPGIDGGRHFDWGRTSADYARHRPGPPESFYARLRALGIGLPGQKILDVGTGTGLLANYFAAHEASVSGVDPVAEQIAMAKQQMADQPWSIDFRVAPAEALPFPKHCFDVVTANQCWWYFDVDRVVPEVLRVLKDNGLLVVSFFNFAPRLDPLVAASEALVLKYNPDWTGASWDGVVEPQPAWSKGILDLRAMFYYDEAIPFSHQSWRGRMRALRGIGATLDDHDVQAFDVELAELLKSKANDPFKVIHRISAHVFAALASPNP